jgi:hypothetical protein
LGDRCSLGRIGLTAVAVALSASGGGVAPVAFGDLITVGYRESVWLEAFSPASERRRSARQDRSG